MRMNRTYQCYDLFFELVYLQFSESVEIHRGIFCSFIQLVTYAVQE